MKIFFQGKMISPIGSTKTLKGKTAKEITGPRRRLIAQYKFDKSIYENLIPEFNAEFTNYEIVDQYLDTEDIVTRYIYSEESPTLIKFGTSESSDRSNSLIKVIKVDTSSLTTMNQMFNNCSNMTVCNTEEWKTSKVIDMNSAFRDCKSLTTLDLSNFDTSNVTRMDHMFRDCNKLTSLDLNNFITNNVTDMSWLFGDCNKLTSLVLGNGFNMDNVTNIAYIFSECNNLILLIVPNATISMKLDDHLPTRTADSPGTLIVTGDKYNLDIKTPESKYWYISDKYKIAEYKFDNTVYDLIPEFNAEFTDYTYEDVVDGEVTTRTIYSDSLPTLMRFGLSAGAVNSTDSLLEINELNTSNVTDMSYMFCHCRNLTSLDVSNFNTSKVTNMSYMFYHCEKIEKIDISQWNVDNVTSIEYMFEHCKAIQSLDLSNFKLKQINSIRSLMFGCVKLTQLNLSNWDIEHISNYNMEYLFNSMNLTSLIMNNSNYNSVNKIIEQLPTRTTDSIGTLNIDRIDNIGQVDIDTLNNKYWIIASHTIQNYERLDQTKLGN